MSMGSGGSDLAGVRSTGCCIKPPEEGPHVFCGRVRFPPTFDDSARTSANVNNRPGALPAAS